MRSRVVRAVIEFKNRLPQTLRQVIKFGSVGVFNTLIDAGLYFLLTRAFGMMRLQTLAKAISYAGGICNSFYWNKHWTFRSQKNASLRMIGTFVGLNLVSLIVNAGVMALGLHVLQLHELVSLVLATAAAMGWNFLTMRRFVFAQIEKRP